MTIFGYSERGIINSLIFSIGEDRELMKEFINLIGIPELKELGNPNDYDIFLEQSFSQFGDADLVIKVCYDDPKNDKVLFIEGKVKTSQSNHWNIEKQFAKFSTKEDYKGYSSNLFFQLHLKKLMIDNWEKLINKNGFALEPRLNKQRKIGENKIVKEAFNKLKKCEGYYIGLIPTTDIDIKDFVNKNNSTGIHFLSWHKVKEFSIAHNLEKVNMNFDYNEGQIFNAKSINSI